jgi:signal transduction histidine kinase
MTNFLFIHKILVLIIDLSAIALAYIVYSRNPRGKINKIFFLMCFLMIGWISFAYLGRFFAIESPSIALLSLKIAWFITPLFFCGLYLLVVNITEVKKYFFLNRIIIFWGIIISLISAFTNLIIKNFQVVDGSLEIIYGKGIGLFLSYGIVLIALTIFLIFKSYFKLSQEQKLKIQYLFIGLIIFYSLNIIFNILLPIFFHKTDLYYLGDYSTIIFLGFTGYAIVAKELFGIRVILTQVLVGAIAVLLLWQAIVAENLFDFAWKITLFLLFLIFGYFLIRSVIQEIKRRAELRRLYEEVNKLSKAKSEFISIASHQLRTPLTAVKGYISMIIEGTYGKLSEKLEKPLENVYQSNERLIKLVNDLLNLSRLEAGKLEFKPEPTSLEKMISNIVEELKINAEKKGLYIRIVKAPKLLPKTMVDQDKLRQVILNIIDNAIKYTKKGGITIGLKKLDSREQIKISDTGEGMDKKEIKSLFQMFTRATAGTQLHREGAGIGLYVAKRFVDMHNGKIWAESPGKEKGSTFYIELPTK